MTRWEYRFVQVTPYHIAISINDQNLNEPYPSVWDIANNLGLDGWELVGIENGSENSIAMYVFKREIDIDERN